MGLFHIRDHSRKSGTKGRARLQPQALRRAVDVGATHVTNFTERTLYTTVLKENGNPHWGVRLGRQMPDVVLALGVATRLDPFQARDASRVLRWDFVRRCSPGSEGIAGDVYGVPIRRLENYVHGNDDANTLYKDIVSAIASSACGL